MALYNNFQPVGQKYMTVGDLYANKLLDMEFRLTKMEEYLRHTEQNQARIMEENRLLRREIIKVRVLYGRNYQIVTSRQMN